ncbi:MAG: hypothetical protein KJN89_13655 [Gammaproteobacteria bacterium]|nr:hypothetical protein [Gammaproteobacteria bacterium]MBT8134341.1 hypothetical protein [Gammaproteobacteria bacterium]
MSTSDQAKSKLLDSMRVSKQGAKEVPDAKQTAPVKKAAPASKAKAAPANKAKATKKAAKPAVSKKTASDSYQAAKRVWPD